MSKFNKGKYKNGGKTKTLVEITKNLNKKGRLKGRNKKETRMLRAACVHHKYNKHGVPKGTLSRGTKGYCWCGLCKSRVRINFYDNEVVQDTVNLMKDINNQAKYTATAINGGGEIIDYFATTGIILDSYPKQFKKVTNIAKQHRKIKNKKYKKGGSSADYGSWGKIR